MENEIIQQLDVIAKNIQALAEPKFIEYIALIFSFIGIIVSGIAIWFAVQVPKKIADRQDNIALFEKRFNLYKILISCNSFGENLMKLDLKAYNSNSYINNIFNSCFSNYKYNTITNNTNEILDNIIITLKNSNFIVQLDDKEKEAIDYIYKAIPYIYQSRENNEEIKDCLIYYCEKMQYLKENTILKLEKLLDIKSR